MAKLETKFGDMFTSSKHQKPGIYENNPGVKINKTTKILLIIFAILVAFYIYYFYNKFSHRITVPEGYQYSDGSDGPPKLVPIKK